MENSLIVLKNDVYVLDPEVSKQIAEFERQAAEIKDKEGKLKEAILNEMEEKNILGIETDDIRISYIGATDRETFDSKSFQKDNKVLYDEYVRMTPVKSSIRIKLK